MNRWIAAIAMGLATAANAPAAAPDPSAHPIVSSAEAAPSAGAAHAQVAGFVAGRHHASLTSAGDGDALASSGPDPLVAWMLAAGFLGIIVVRRTRDTHGF